MTHSPIYQYMLGAGYNLPLGSLTNVELIQGSDGKYLYPPDSFGSFNVGQETPQLNGLNSYQGFESVEWNWTGNGGKGYITYGGARTLRTNFFNGVWSATLTIYTKTSNELSYERYNAVGTMKQFPDSAPNFKAFTGFGIRLTHLIGPL